ncbi:hypothetical protein K7I13_06140 [Brucepastera parasyntrophica]|uniref:hypothetical protein n=1 Tax=Brucepastera parasyntrophica TaxID=2880008 RepID=UPI00210A362E|nr:hypothetical protein [Brucepastera parasyntrophica]ULQ60843.1 hypothetical protein K7I13_06140 [Brucepastera parasyntrophica]
MKYAIDNKTIHEAKEEYEKFSKTAELRDAYEAHMKWVLGYNQSRADGEAAGFEKGRAMGLEEGAKGKALETARKMKAAEISVDDIITFTGLSAEQIAEL